MVLAILGTKMVVGSLCILLPTVFTPLSSSGLHSLVGVPYKLILNLPDLTPQIFI